MRTWDVNSNLLFGSFRFDDDDYEDEGDEDYDDYGDDYYDRDDG